LTRISYNTKVNYAKAKELDAKAYIPFKEKTTGNVKKKMRQDSKSTGETSYKNTTKEATSNPVSTQ
jgi:hypothetical protein